MTHLPYVLSCYVLGVLIPAAFGVAAMKRLRAARQKLAALDPRHSTSGRRA